MKWIETKEGVFITKGYTIVVDKGKFILTNTVTKETFTFNSLDKAMKKASKKDNRVGFWKHT